MKTFSDRYDDIFKATVEQDSDAAWKLIYAYMPCIKKECTDPETGNLNDDLLSEIMSKLPNRIKKFTVQSQSEHTENGDR